jgi:hypothetical protein
VSISVRIPLLTLVLTVSLAGSVSAEFPIGDLTGDCDVNSLDLQIFVGQWLAPSGCSGHPDDCADFDSVNGINSTDFALFAANWLIKTGSLQITILPPEAAAAGAQWRVDGGEWRDSGYTETCVPAGTHTVECKSIADWNEPNSQTVEINDYQTTTTTATYIRHTGSLQATILPPEAAAAGAQWRVDGGTWRNSGYTETALTVGSHTVEYSVVSGWYKPADEIVQINNGQTTVNSGTYVLQTGSLQVTISPQAAIDAEAQWRVDGGAWRDSDYTESGLPVGSHTVEYSTVSGWNKPADEIIQINDGLTTTTTGTYTQQTGYLQVTISPQGAIDAGAQWRVDGGVWRDSGYTLGGLIVGSHTVEYSTVAGWDTPVNEMIQINDGQTTTITGTYIQQTGSLQVTISPQEAIDAGAQWRVDNRTWRDSGFTETDLLAGPHTIRYKDISDWNTPADETVQINGGQTTTTTGTYIQQTGSLQVTISPQAAIDAGARWRVDGGTWRDNGYTETGLSIGSHTVEYDTISGWNEPASESVQINDGQTTTVTGTYVLQTGSLQVTISPQAAIDAGAQWRVDGGTWRNSGYTESGLLVGLHTVEYKPIADWNEPNTHSVQINDGQTTTTTGTYIQHTGSLQVTILPLEAALSGAQWRVDGGTWRLSGFTESGLSLGSHTVEYLAIVGWNTPDNENVQINHGQTTTTTGTYIQQTGSLQVTIFPQEAIDAGAKWRVDDGAWRDSNYIETGLLVGFYSVEFSVVAGWDRPANQMVQINNNQTTTTSAAYVQQIHALLTISEFMASNASEAPLDPGELLDGDGLSSDWIEIYNQTGETVSLDGWYLTDDDDELTKWQFPDGLQINAGQFRIVFASGKTSDLYPLNYPYLDPGGYYHTNFNLDSPGEYLALVAPDGNTIVYEYEPKYPEQLTNVSYGLARYEVMLVPTGATASYHVPTGADAALGTDWADVGFNDLAWDTGTTAFGFGGGVATDVQQEMQNVNASLWTRIEFNLEDDQRDLFDTFLLRIKYEDGFVAYLNGQEVTSRNAPNSVEWNSTADSNRPGADSAVFEEINLMPFLNTLRIGRNVLAIQGLNDNPADDEFLVLPELVGASNIDVPQYFVTATPGELNIADAMGVVGEVWFSHERGYYDTGFQLELSTAMDDAQIRYTTDGSRPSITHGTVYTGPINISQTTTVRAIAVQPGWLSANPDAHTYLFLYDVANQPKTPPGFPTSWGSYTADYQVDPDVVNTTLPGYSFEEGLLWIPSVCITMLTDDLFGADDGIYVYSTSKGDQWERPASIELIYPDGREGFQINAGVHMHGGASRNHSSTLKHSFRLVFRGIYGPTKLNFPLFEDSDVEEFDQLVLRGSSGDSWTYPDSYRDGVIRHIKIQAQYTRDPWMKDSQRAMGHNSANSIFVHVYLNGLYWGQYNLCERPNSSFQASYMGGDKDDYDAIHDYEELQSGTFDIWNQMFDMAAAGLASDTDAQFIQGNNPDGTRNPNYPILLDVDNLIDYMILHHFARSEDWPCHNFWSGRRRGSKSEGFKFFVWDQENHNNTLERFITGCGCHIEVLPGEVSRSLRPGYLYARLRDNPMFRRKYGDRIHKHMFNDGLLTIEKVEERWMKRATEVDKSVVAESARWGDAKRSNPYKREVEFLTEQNRLHTEYWPFISAIVLDRYRGVGLYPDIEAPVFRINDANQHGGHISDTDELTMDNPNGSSTIYYTIDGNDPRLPESTEIYGTTLVNEDAPKKVLVPTGSVNDNWKGGGPFNDSSWNDGTYISGKAGGVGYDERADYKPFISYDVESLMNADLTSGANTSCYIRIPFTLTGDPCDFNFMSLNIRYDDGFVAYLNGDELDRKNFPEGDTPLWNSNASGGHEASGLETIPVSDHLDSLKQGDNILAIHGMNNSNTSSDFLISAQLVVSDVNSTSGGVSPDAIEYNNERLTFNKSTHVKACVLEGETWSALNEAVFAVGPVAENLRITEIMYHPRYTGDPADPNTEFIELKNIGPAAINLNLAEFTKGIDFVFPDIELESGEYVVVVKDIVAFQAKYGTSINTAGQYTGSLANDGERIKLRDAVGRTILDFEYRDGWRSITDGDGFSLTIIDPADSEPNNWDQKEFWRASVYRNGSPGSDDSGILPNPGAVVINEVMAHSNAGPDWIELHNTTDETINIGGWFLSDNNRSEPNLMKYRIADGATIEPNDYLVFYQDTDFNNPGNPGCIVPFGLSENGEKACLSSYLDPNGFLTGYRQVEDFGASQTNVSLGRYYKPSTGNFNFVAMDYNTPDANNAYPKVGPVVINEIMYNPPSGNQNEEYIELHNITGAVVTLYRYDKSEPWKFTDGLDYTFSSSPPVTIPAYGYVMVVKNIAAFTARYGGMPPGVQVLIGYSGRLSNAGERLQIGMPGDLNELGVRQYIRIDRVTYSDGWHPEDCPGGVDLWPIEADGLGKSLSRKVSADYGNDVANWEAAVPSPGVANP